MITRRINYDRLLDKLKKVCENYHINEKGLVIDQNGEEETNENIITRLYFGVLYHMAYNATKHVAHDETIDINTYYNLAFMDYSTFNSFINNCINECKIYNDIGGDDFQYIPYQELAGYMLNDENNKQIVINYLKSEFKDALSFEKGKRKSKRID